MPEARIASGREELARAFELVYRSYVARGYLQTHRGGVVYQAAFGLDSSRTIVALTEAGEVAGTVTIVGDNPLGLQLEATFGGEVESLRKAGRRLAEVTCLAVDPESGFGPGAVFFALTRLALQHARWRQLDDLLLAVHPRHHVFYRRCFRAYAVGPCRAHGPVRGNPAVCCRIDMRRLRENMAPPLWERYFCPMRTREECEGGPMAFADHAYFCRRRGIAPDAGHAGRDARRRLAG